MLAIGSSLRISVAHFPEGLATPLPSSPTLRKGLYYTVF